MALGNGSRVILFILAAAALVPGWGAAHQVSSVSLIANIDTEKQTYLLDAAMEVVPSEDPALNDQIPPERAARDFAEDYLSILFDEQEMHPDLDIELIDASDENTPDALQRRQVTTKMGGKIPEGAKEFLLYLDPSCPMAVVMVVIKDNRPSRRMQVVLAGEYSRPVSVEPVIEGDPFDGKEGKAKESAASAKPEAEKKAVEKAPEPAAEETAETESTPELASGWKSFFDGSCLALLLLIGILLLTTRGRPVIVQVAVLLIFQSLSLALAAWDILRPIQQSETILAVLIAAISIEAVFHRDLKWWRCVLVAGAGWVSGWHLAETAPFRAVFQAGQPPATTDVMEFLVGVELAFIAVGVAAAAILLFLNRFPWYRQWVVQPLAVFVTAFALFRVVDSFL